MVVLPTFRRGDHRVVLALPCPQRRRPPCGGSACSAMWASPWSKHWVRLVRSTILGPLGQAGLPTRLPPALACRPTPRRLACQGDEYYSEWRGGRPATHRVVLATWGWGSYEWTMFPTPAPWGAPSPHGPPHCWFTWSGTDRQGGVIACACCSAFLHRVLSAPPAGCLLSAVRQLRRQSLSVSRDLT